MTWLVFRRKNWSKTGNGLELPFIYLDQRILILITNFVFDDQNLLLTTDSFSSSTEIYVLQEEVF